VGVVSRAVGSRLQQKQQKLSWSLYMARGFYVNLRTFIPDSVSTKKVTLAYLDAMIEELRNQLRSLR
jgi:hypothetical protein